MSDAQPDQTATHEPIHPTADPAAAPIADAPAAAAGTDPAAELAEMRDRWLRAEAEAQNARARHRKELDDARNYAVQRFATDVAEAADNLRRGLDALPPPADGEAEILGKLRGGFEGVERAMIAMLERHGVKRLDAAGQPFDPAFHQAMSEQPAPPGVAPGTVVQAWTPAWTLNGRLLRPAMVVVAGQP